MSNEQPIHTVDIICDLRQFSADLDDVGSMQNLWRKIGGQLPGRKLISEKPLTVKLPEGDLALWVLDAHGATEVTSDTNFRIVDLVRSPKLIYSCQVCGKYGPLRCIECEHSGQETRLCAVHAHTIKDELRAFCTDHIPKCSCKHSCNENATFRCQRCHRLYGDHVHRSHPHDKTVDYCQLCYRILFERCEAVGCNNLGRSKCAYQTREMNEQCGKPLCAEHSFQWKIWGPHNRGVTLCAQHKGLLGATDPSDLLFMMLTADAPFIHRGKRYPLPNPFRLRRIINRNRTAGLSFDHLGRALKSLENQVQKWGGRARKNYQFMSKSYFETTNGLSGIETDLLNRVRSFYEQASGVDNARQISGLEITDRFFKPGQPARYRVKLYLNTSNKGPFIGRGGSTISQLRQSLNIEIDLES